MFKSSTFRPLFEGTLSKRIGHDVKGRPTFDEGEPVAFSIVKHYETIELTSIRADRSGSKSRAEEVILFARLMFERDADVQVGDRFTMFGDEYQVARAFKRHDMTGAVHHIQADLGTWR